MDLFYHTRERFRPDNWRQEKKEVCCDEQKVIDDALDSIRLYKEKQAAGIPDITVSDFISEVTDQMALDDERKIQRTTLLTINQIVTRIDSLNIRMGSIDPVNAEYELELLQSALNRKNMSVQRKAQIQSDLNTIQKRMDDRRREQKEQEDLMVKFRKEQNEAIQNNVQQYSTIYNQPAPGGTGNDPRNRRLIDLIDSRLKLIEDREREEQLYVDKQFNSNQEILELSREAKEMKRKIISLDYEINQLIESPFILSERRKTVFHQFIEQHPEFSIFMANKKLLQITSSSEIDRTYLVTNCDFDLCATLAQQHPRLLVNWESLFSNPNQLRRFIQRIKSNQQSAFEEYRELENRYFNNRDRGRPIIMVIPSIFMSSDVVWNNTNIRNRIFFITDGIKHEWFDYNQSFNSILARNQVISKYDAFYDYKILSEFSRLRNIQLSYVI